MGYQDEAKQLPDAVPELDDVAGQWVDVDDLAHLPSLRNQVGQAHVNFDLASVSWLAAPPYSLGYHTGVLRLDGRILDAQRYRWKPWGTEREHANERLAIRTDTRMGLGEDTLLWEIVVRNTTDRSIDCAISQDLFAMVAHTEVGWGWLYDVPWTAGNYHDFMTLERIRATTRDELDGAAYLLAPGARALRLGKPRPPGIQRSAPSEQMLLASELPRHVSPDTVYPYDRGANATVRNVWYRFKVDEPVTVLQGAEVRLKEASEVLLGAFEMCSGLSLGVGLRLELAGQSGVVLTHGNHPDSLQLGLDGGRPWVAIAGEKELASADLEAGRWYEVMVLMSDERVVLYVDGQEQAATRHWSTSRRWGPVVTRRRVIVVDRQSPARAAYAFAAPPSWVERFGSGARATWELHLGAGEASAIGLVLAYGDDATRASAVAERVARDLPVEMERCAQGYRHLWRDMFTPGNTEFSGHFPTLAADDPGIAKSYYMGALTALYMRNVRASSMGPVFLTGGPRLGPTVTYFWDHTEWSRLYGLLEPAGLRSWLLRSLKSPYEEAFGFDTRNGGALGNEYIANPYALFRLVEHYVCTSGDWAFLAEPAGAKTVFEHLEGFACGWQDKRGPETDSPLADFGADPWRMLECVPNYVNVVASFNAAYVGMLRSFAGLLRRRGELCRAAVAEAQASALAAAVVAMLRPGGRWEIRHPGASETIGHCLDFGLVGAYLPSDLSDAQRHEMTAFVPDKLLSATWMRALAVDDPAAARSDRPDHGAAGAFGAWPGVTAHALAQLGRRDLAAQLLSVVHAAASGALWGQAMEIVEDARGQWARVAEGSVSNRDAIAGVAISEAVVSGLFGFSPSFADDPSTPQPERIEAEGIGTLSNINTRQTRRQEGPHKLH